jgi:glutathione S-transferase
MVAIPYKNVYIANPRKGPKGKLPFIIDGDQKIADSAQIINYLQAVKGTPRLDQHLTPSEQAISLAMCHMFEDHLYWVLIYSRWVDDVYWKQIKPIYFGSLPSGFKSIAAADARRTITRDLYGHGLGRHQEADVYQMGKRDIRAFSDFLADKPFAMGQQPSVLDAVAYAFIAHVLRPPLATPLQKAAQALPNLVEYEQRMTDRYYPNSIKQKG